MLERLLIVGFGSIGRRHVRLAREMMPEARIAVLRHRNCQDLPEGVEACFTSLEEALQFAPQAAVIASPSSVHLMTALPLAQAGVHLLIEKPISNLTQGLVELIDVCRTNGVVLMTGYNLRFLPSLQRFRELIEEDRVGRVLSVRAEVGQYLPSWRPGTDYRDSVSAKAELGGGVLLELSHEIDYLLWLFGEAQWVRAVLLKQSDLEIDVEDVAHLIIGFAYGPEKSPVVATLNMDFIRHDTTRCCTIIGERGSLRWNALSGSVDIFDQKADSWHTLYAHHPQRDESYLEEWRHFLRCISSRQLPLVSGQDGLAVLDVIDAARRSSREGNVIRLV